VGNSQWNGGFRPDSDPSRGDPCRAALRPIQASKAAIRNGCFTSIRDLQSHAGGRLCGRFSLMRPTRPCVSTMMLAYAMGRVVLEMSRPLWGTGCWRIL
jgi:hypothetical protein